MNFRPMDLNTWYTVTQLTTAVVLQTFPARLPIRVLMTRLLIPAKHTTIGQSPNVITAGVISAIVTADTNYC